jgi:diacylglycerol kinase family enzyme
MTLLPVIRNNFTEHGFSTEVLLTTGERDSVRLLAAEAASRSSLVVACGGDGTVHDVVQGLAGTKATLGVLPLGTANALARNLKLPLDPVAGVPVLLSYAPRRIPLGVLTTAAGQRFFAVMAGCGPDGALALAAGGRWKLGLGRSAYYAHAAWLFATRRWPEFEVRYRRAGEICWETTTVVGLMASRVGNLGGIFSRLTARARLEDTTLHVQLLHAPAQISLPAWFVHSRLGVRSRYWTTVDVEELECSALGGDVVHAQADAEPMGGLPVGMGVAMDALSLLMPRDREQG